MDRQRLQAHRLRNLVQQAALLVLLALLLGYLAWVVGGAPFVWGTLLGVALLFLVNPVASPRLVLGMYGARELGTSDTPGLYGILAELGRRAGLERIPRLYYLPSRMINAFATGRAKRRGHRSVRRTAAPARPARGRGGAGPRARPRGQR